jgi:hypothetical protein
MQPIIKTSTIYECPNCGLNHKEKDFIDYHVKLCTSNNKSFFYEYLPYFNINEEVYFLGGFSSGLAILKKCKVTLLRNEKNGIFEIVSEYFDHIEYKDNLYATSLASDGELPYNIFKTKDDAIYYKKYNKQVEYKRKESGVKIPLDLNKTYFIKYRSIAHAVTIEGLTIYLSEKEPIIIYTVKVKNEKHNVSKPGVNWSVDQEYDYIEKSYNELFFSMDDVVVL